MRLVGIVLGLLMLTLATPSHAQTKKPVWIVMPATETCVDVTQLLMGIAHGGPFFPSLIPAPMLEGFAPTPLFQLTGPPKDLRVQAWGLASTTDVPATNVESSLPVLDETLSPQTCTTISEAAVALIVSALSESLPVNPDRSGPHPDAQELTAAERTAVSHLTLQLRLQEVLRSAQSVAGSDVSVHIATSPSGELALELRAHPACRSELALDLVAEPTFDVNALKEQARVLRDCAYAQRKKAQTQRAMLERQAASRTSANRDTALRPPPFDVPSWRLPGFAPAIGLGLGAAVAVGSLQTLSDPLPLLSYGSTPIAVGSVASLLVNEQLREPVLLSGYWLSVAGTSVTLASAAGTPKDVLIAGALAGGSLASTALLVLSELSSPVEARLPLWAIAAPAVAGALTGALAFFLVEGSSEYDSQLAFMGGAAAVLPAAWLWLRLPSDHRDRQPSLTKKRVSVSVQMLPGNDSMSVPTSGALVSATGVF